MAFLGLALYLLCNGKIITQDLNHLLTIAVHLLEVESSQNVHVLMVVTYVLLVNPYQDTPAM